MSQPLKNQMEQIKKVREADFPGLARLSKKEPPTPTEESCYTCQFWRPRKWCLRFPKSEIKDRQRWCGEYKEEK